MKSDKNSKFVFWAAILTLFLTFVASEVLLRVLGFGPWHYVTKDVTEPTMHQYDPELGWIMKEGEYVFDKGGRTIQVTLMPNHTRATGSHLANGSMNLAFVGGSVTQGWALSDNETFAWKLQSRFPSLQILNYATAGYGTYQSLLMLEKVFTEESTKPDVVMYGFNWRHEHRNVAPSWWLAGLTRFSQRNHVFVPYCTLDESGELRRHPPERYPVWPLREYSALVNFVQTVVMNLQTRGREPQKRAVTEKLILKMRELCRKNDATFVVVMLSAERDSKAHYIHFLKSNNVSFVDCTLPIPPEMRIPGDGHPNAVIHSRWSECISEKIEHRLLEVKSIDELSLKYETN